MSYHQVPRNPGPAYLPREYFGHRSLPVDGLSGLGDGLFRASVFGGRAGLGNNGIFARNAFGRKNAGLGSFLQRLLGRKRALGSGDGLGNVLAVL